MQPWLVPVVAFVLGSIPSGLWIGRMARGIDIREHGSRNLGATNVYRTLGAKWGILVLVLDAAKGWVAVALGAGAGEGTIAAASTSGAGLWALVAMAAALLGHMFSPFASFRGGKGVATAAGAWLALALPPVIVVIGVWALVFALRRIVSLASVCAAIALPVMTALFEGAGWERSPVFWAACAVALLVILRHRANLSRLLRREEAPLALRRTREDPSSGGRP